MGPFQSSGEITVGHTAPPSYQNNPSIPVQSHNLPKGWTLPLLFALKSAVTSSLLSLLYLCSHCSSKPAFKHRTEVWHVLPSLPQHRHKHRKRSCICGACTNISVYHSAKCKPSGSYKSLYLIQTIVRPYLSAQLISSKFHIQGI